MMDSFWSTSYGQDIMSLEHTPIDRLLSSSDTILEDLMDDDELLQQCSNKNTALITFLSKEENITKLIAYITRPWQEHMTRIVAHLEEQEALAEERKESNPESTTQSDNLSPLISPIQEEPDGDGDDENEPLMTLDEEINVSSPIIDNVNDDKRIESKEEDPTDTTLSQDKDDDIDLPNPPNHPIAVQSQSETENKESDDQIVQITNNVESTSAEPNESNTTTTTNDNDDHHNEPFDRYDDLKLSDDETLSPDEADHEEDEKDTDVDATGDLPKLHAKSDSAVETLMAGPEFEKEVDAAIDATVQEEENVEIDDAINLTGVLTPDDIDNPEPNSAADPELPEFEVGSGDINDDDAAAGDSVTIFDHDNDGVPPPPPPPPEEPSRVEEIQSEVGIERVKLKYPYLASEIINCQIPQILDSILDANRPFLDMLFDFIEQKPPLNAVLTNYWRSCVVGLVRRDSPVILQYIRRRRNLLSSLVQHIRDQSIMELVIALGWDPAIEELKELDEVADWMYDEQLVPKLIATLSPHRSPDEHSAASYTLVDIVAKTSRSTNLVLFHNLASSVQIDALMNHMFAGNRSSLLESLSVLLALLHHYPNVSAEKQQFGEESPPQQHVPPPPPPDDDDDDDEEEEQMTENPLAPKSPDLPSDSITKNDENDHDQNDCEKEKEDENENEDEVAIQNENGNQNENENESNKLPESTTNPVPTDTESKEESGSTSASNENENETNNDNIDDVKDIKDAASSDEIDEEKFDDSVPAVVKAVCLRLPDFKRLLETAPSRDLELPFCKLSPPLGPVRHKVVDMIVALMRTPSPMVSRKLKELGLIRICIDLFFAYPWNNLLHGSVEHIIQMVVSGDCAILKQALFEDCDFLNRILKARESSAKHQEEKKFRLGFMGHITRVSNTIVEFAKRNQQLDDYMKANEEWMEFIGEALKLENEQLNTQLGGHRPSAMNGDDGDEFSLFALGNIPANVGGGGSEEDASGNLLAEDGDIAHLDGIISGKDHLDDPDIDSDSDEDDDEEHDGNKAYEMPQDAFTRLTQTMDDEEEEAKKREETGDLGDGANADFDQWLNDDGDWGGFGDENDANDANDNVNEFNTSPLSQEADQMESKEANDGVDAGDENKGSDLMMNGGKENIESVKINDDTDFADWDEDPFANDPILAQDLEPTTKEEEEEVEDSSSNLKQEDDSKSKASPQKDSKYTMKSAAKIDNGMEASQVLRVLGLNSNSNGASVMSRPR